MCEKGLRYSAEGRVSPISLPGKGRFAPTPEGRGIRKGTPGGTGRRQAWSRRKVPVGKRKRSDGDGDLGEDFLEGRAAPVPGVPGAEPRVSLGLEKGFDLPEKDVLEWRRPGTPPPDLVEIRVQHHHDRDGSRPVGQVGIHQIRVRVPGKESKLEVGRDIGQLRQIRQGIGPVPTPFLTESQEMPLLLQIPDSLDQVSGYTGPLVELPPGMAGSLES